MKFLPAMFVLVVVVVGLVHSIPVDEVSKHCHKTAIQNDHLAGWRTTECKLTCINYMQRSYNTTTWVKDILTPGILCTYDLDDNCNEDEDGLCNKNVTFNVHSTSLVNALSESDRQRDVYTFRGCSIPKGVSIQKALSNESMLNDCVQCDSSIEQSGTLEMIKAINNLQCHFDDKVAPMKGRDLLLLTFVTGKNGGEMASAQLYANLPESGDYVSAVQVVSEFDTEIDDDATFIQTTRHFLFLTHY